MQVHESLYVDVKQRSLAHMIDVVRGTPVHLEPFPHFIVGEFFPSDVYEELLFHLPAGELYEPFSYPKHSTKGRTNRGRFKLTDDAIGRLSSWPREFWLAIRDALGAVELKRAVFEKLQAGLAFRYGIDPQQAANLPGYALPELFRETEGYTIKPHPDTRRKVVTMQIALPHDNRQAALGTEFYQRSFDPRSLLRQPRGFNVAKRVPFLPNVAYAFSVLNTVSLKSWHGRTTLDAGVGVRNTILNLWYANVADGNPDLVRQLDEEMV